MAPSLREASIERRACATCAASGGSDVPGGGAQATNTYAMPPRSRARSTGARSRVDEGRNCIAVREFLGEATRMSCKCPDGDAETLRPNGTGARALNICRDFRKQKPASVAIITRAFPEARRTRYVSCT